MANTITIVVTGARGAGKTAILTEIQKMLTAKGIKFNAKLEGRYYEELSIQVTSEQIIQLYKNAS